MDYRKYGSSYYIRIDKNEEIIKSIIDICKNEKIMSAVFSGIGGCKEAEIQTFIPESGTFDTEIISGMLELISVNGNIITDNDNN
ncbi:MAG: DNA-binding protein, partial [Firmicutes bacterium]|nr:DNA-binding protein [Bacillota bacterium]